MQHFLKFIVEVKAARLSHVLKPVVMGKQGYAIALASTNPFS